MQTWTSNRKPDGKALVRWLLDVRGSLEMPRILDLNVSHVAIHLQTKYWWNQWFTWNTLIFAFFIQQSQTGRIVSRHTCLWLLTKDLGCVLVTVLLFIYLFLYLSWTKVLGHFCFSGAFFNSHRSNPSPHPTTMLHAFIQNFFRVSTLYRVGGGRTARKSRKGCTVLRGSPEMTE